MSHSRKPNKLQLLVRDNWWTIFPYMDVIMAGNFAYTSRENRVELRGYLGDMQFSIVMQLHQSHELQELDNRIADEVLQESKREHVPLRSRVKSYAQRCLIGMSVSLTSYYGCVKVIINGAARNAYTTLRISETAAAMNELFPKILGYCEPIFETCVLYKEWGEHARKFAQEVATYYCDFDISYISHDDQPRYVCFTDQAVKHCSQTLADAFLTNCNEAHQLAGERYNEIFFHNGTWEMIGGVVVGIVVLGTSIVLFNKARSVPDSGLNFRPFEGSFVSAEIQRHPLVTSIDHLANRNIASVRRKLQELARVHRTTAAEKYQALYNTQFMPPVLNFKELSCGFFKKKPVVGMLALDIDENDANDLDVSLLGRGRKSIR